MEVTNCGDIAYVASPFATAMVGGDGKKKAKHGTLTITKVTAADKTISAEGTFVSDPKWQVKTGSFLATAIPKTKPGLFGQVDFTRKITTGKVGVNPGNKTFSTSMTKDLAPGDYDVFVQMAISEIGNDANTERVITFAEINVK